MSAFTTARPNLGPLKLGRLAAKIESPLEAVRTRRVQVKDMATEQRERFMSVTEWKFIGFLVLALLLTPIFYGLPLLSPLFAMSTSVRTHRTKMVWLWVVASLLVLMSIAPFILRLAGLSNFVVD